MLALAAHLVEAAPRLSQIWPGYWPPEQPFILYLPGEGALLVSAGEKPSSFQPLVTPQLPERLKGRAFWHAGALADVRTPFVTGYSIGGGKTAILVDATTVKEENLAPFLLHEQFHDYQKHAFRQYALSDFVDPLAVRDRAAFAASAEAERRILIKAFGTEEPQAARRLLQQYFAIRRARQATMPADAVKVERALERIEGTAYYVDRTGIAVLDGRSGGAAGLLVARLQKPLVSEAGAFTSVWFRSRSYGTGAAMTWFVSRLGGEGWRKQLEGGAAPDELLESLVGKPSPKAAVRLAREARASIGYASIYRALEPAIRTAEKGEIKSAAEFLVAAPYRVILEVEGIEQGDTGFSASSMVPLGPSTTALPHVTTFGYTAPSMTLSARNVPVLMESGRYTVVTPSAPEIVGLTAPAPGEHRLASLLIRSKELELRIDKPVIVTVSEKSMTIRIGGR